MCSSNEIDVKQELFDGCNKKIDDLYTFRDKYYILNEKFKTAEDRNKDLLQKLNELVQEIESIDPDQFDSKASYLVLIGRAFNVLPDYNQKAFDSLTKAIKLDPKSIGAWNYLGECYWKKRDFEMCKNCFERSLNLKKTKLSLRGMSMVMRQLINVPSSKEELLNQNLLQQNDPSQPSPPQQQQQHQQQQQSAKFDRIKNLLEESIRYAKDSLQLDLKDGMSWYILANCYVAKFFSPFGQQSPGLLKQAITAYNLAQKHESASLQSDLFFNKSMISMYEENWSDVLICLSKALQLDPNWNDARENLKGTLDYLNQITEMISSKGKLKAKKLQSLIESINKNDLGPYLDGYQKNVDNENVSLVETKLRDLVNGSNANKVLVGKVICGLPTKNAENFNMVCFTCCIVDSNGDCAALTIYNLAGGHGVIIGNSVTIPEPWIENVDIKFKPNDFLKNTNKLNENFAIDEFEFKFKSVRVENPTVLVVNGRKWTKEKVSSAFFVPKVIAD